MFVHRSIGIGSAVYFRGLNPEAEFHCAFIIRVVFSMPRFSNCFGSVSNIANSGVPGGRRLFPEDIVFFRITLAVWMHFFAA